MEHRFKQLTGKWITPVFQNNPFILACKIY